MASPGVSMRPVGLLSAADVWLKYGAIAAAVFYAVGFSYCLGFAGEAQVPLGAMDTTSMLRQAVFPTLLLIYGGVPGVLMRGAPSGILRVLDYLGPFICAGIFIGVNGTPLQRPYLLAAGFTLLAIASLRSSLKGDATRALPGDQLAIAARVVAVVILFGFGCGICVGAARKSAPPGTRIWLTRDAASLLGSTPELRGKVVLLYAGEDAYYVRLDSGVVLAVRKSSTLAISEER
ncbi:MAG: hypothetical protein ACRD3Q_20925 [Terriglobales bacterium]